MSQINPFQNSALNSNNAGARGDIRNVMVVQNGVTFPNVQVATTACVAEVSLKIWGACVFVYKIQFLTTLLIYLLELLWCFG
jgi:hypothetical protein